MRPGTVYVARDAEGTPLYVGSTFTHRLHDRMAEHRYWSPWYSDTETIECRDYVDKTDALVVEHRLIGTLAPHWNLQRATPFAGYSLSYVPADPVSVSTILSPLGPRSKSRIRADDLREYVERNTVKSVA